MGGSCFASKRDSRLIGKNIGADNGRVAEALVDKQHLHLARFLGYIKNDRFAFEDATG